MADRRVTAELNDILTGESRATLARLGELTREALEADVPVERELSLKTAAIEARALARRFVRLEVRQRDARLAGSVSRGVNDDGGS